MRLKKALYFCAAWVCLVLGLIGIPVPVLPTTPFILLSAFLFAQSSERYHTWLKTTKVYKAYVLSYKERGGITLKRKLQIIGITYVFMGLSGFLVQKVYVWIILVVCAACQFYALMLRIPTIPELDEEPSPPAESLPLTAQTEDPTE